MFVCFCFFVMQALSRQEVSRIAGRVMVNFVCSRSSSSRCDKLRVGRCGRLFAINKD